MTVELDKLDIHNRQQLSALMDGELSPDEARFLLRRLQHDEELGSTWERWQLCGDVLRGDQQGFLRNTSGGALARLDAGHLVDHLVHVRMNPAFIR